MILISYSAHCSLSLSQKLSWLRLVNSSRLPRWLLSSWAAKHKKINILNCCLQLLVKALVVFRAHISQLVLWLKSLLHFETAYFKKCCASTISHYAMSLDWLMKWLAWRPKGAPKFTTSNGKSVQLKLRKHTEMVHIGEVASNHYIGGEASERKIIPGKSMTNISFSQQLPIIRVEPLKGFLSWHCGSKIWAPLALPIRPPWTYVIV